MQKRNSGCAGVASFASILYTRLVPASIFPWNTTSIPWHIEYMFQAMFYMVLGYIFRHNMEAEFDKHNIQFNYMKKTVQFNIEVKALAIGALSTAIMSVCVLMLVQLRLPNTIGLFVEVACGAIVYIAVNMAMKNAFIFELITKIKCKIYRK